MKRIISIFVIIVLLLTMVVGCSQPTSDEEPANAGEVNGEESKPYFTNSLNAICPWSAGGGTDTILRGLSAEAEKSIGQTITVTNQTGGGGAVGHSAIMNAKPDGYTVGMITFELNSLPAQGLVPFTYEDFTPLMRVNMDAAALTVPKDAPYDTVEEFVAYAKENPGTINIGNSGVGAVWHIAAGLMAEATEIEVQYVPFDGAAPAITSLVGGHIQAVSVSAAEVQGQVEAGDLKILGVMSGERLEAFPEVPTFIESGYDVVFGTWRGLAVPVGTPQEAIDELGKAFKTALESKEFVDFAANSGLVLAYQDADEFKEFLKVNAKDVSAVMESLGLAAK
ncbi:MAG: tripartite tricarboxylate transporter substrate binding protein [Clostridia bacterium]|nr:tripartite tricarboxylate transporter substrate binding protein [Clostridia bacterium]